MRWTLHGFVFVVLTAWLFGCATHPKLQPKPVIYAAGRLDLCAIVPESQRTSGLKVFYATNRAPKGPMEQRKYGNGVDETLHLGVATVQLGERGTGWNEVCKAGGDPAFRITRAAESPDHASFYESVGRQLASSPNHEVN